VQEEIDIENLVLQRIKLTLKPIFALFKVFNNPPLISIDVSIEKLHRMERKAVASPLEAVRPLKNADYGKKWQSL